MPSLKITVTVEADGETLFGGPLVRRLDCDELQSFGPYEKAADNDTTTFTTLPVGEIATGQVLLVTADRAINLRLNGQASQLVALAAGGLLLLVDANLTAGATTNATINNPAASQLAVVRGLEAGT